MEVETRPRHITDFWFADTVRPLWFQSTPAFDRSVREQFEATWEAARSGVLDAWQERPEGAEALVIVLDQFPLNMFRGSAESFSTEAQARAVADHAIVQGFHLDMPEDWRIFLFLPFTHSEDLADQDRAVALYETFGPEANLKWARHHREIVRRFGRFPHRNAILGRESTPEEAAWLASDEAFRG